jgi:hypothetical protein
VSVLREQPYLAGIDWEAMEVRPPRTRASELFVMPSCEAALPA